MEAINSDIIDLFSIFLIAKKMVLGTAAFGFFIGSLYFSFYLIQLSRLPRKSKEFRDQC